MVDTDEIEVFAWHSSPRILKVISTDLLPSNLQLKVRAGDLWEAYRSRETGEVILNLRGVTNQSTGIFMAPDGQILKRESDEPAGTEEQDRIRSLIDKDWEYDKRRRAWFFRIEEPETETSFAFLVGGELSSNLTKEQQDKMLSIAMKQVKTGLACIESRGEDPNLIEWR